MPNEIYIRRNHIWRSVFWLYSQHHGPSQCSKCLENTSNILLHWLFECDKHSDYRLFIFKQLEKLKQFYPSLTNHQLFQFIDTWYIHQEHQDNDLDLLDTLLRSFMAPLATSNM